MLERAGELASRNAPTWWNTGVRLAGPMGKEKFLWELFVGGGVRGYLGGARSAVIF